MSSTIPGSPSAFDASFGGRSGTPRGQAAGRDLCRGAVRNAALRGGPPAAAADHHAVYDPGRLRVEAAQLTPT